MFSDSTKVTLLANSLGSLVQPFKSGNSGWSERVAVEPGDDADEIDRCRNAEMLQMRFWQTQIPRATQIKGTHSLRNSRFNPGPQSIPLPESFAALSLTSGLERCVLRLWPDRQGSPLVFGGGTHTIAAARTRAAISGRKLDLDQVRMVLAADWSPAAAGFPLWAGRSLVFPIEYKLTGINARGAMSLPLRVYRHRTHHLNSKASLAVD